MAFCGFSFRFSSEISLGLSRIKSRFCSHRYSAQIHKNTERARRATQEVQRVHIYSQEQNISKQWKKYLSCGENKESLLEFLSNIRNHTTHQSLHRFLFCMPHLRIKVTHTIPVEMEMTRSEQTRFHHLIATMKKQLLAYCCTSSMPQEHLTQ